MDLLTALCVQNRHPLRAIANGPDAMGFGGEALPAYFSYADVVSQKWEVRNMETGELIKAE